MSDKTTKYNFPASDTGGVKSMNIRGIYEDERARLSEEFTDEERQWRKQWLKDQQLSSNEPRPVSEEWIKETRNPIRRFLSKPWQAIEASMTPVVGKTFATTFRYLVPKTLVVVMATYVFWYHCKYSPQDWTRASGIQLVFPKPRAFPGDPDFPVKRERHDPNDYYDRGFKNRKVFLD